MYWKKICIALVLFISMLSAQELILQNGLNGYAGCEDSYIYGKRPTANFGNFKYLNVMNYVWKCCDTTHCDTCHCGQKKDTLTAKTVIKFDISDIPRDARIKKAVLSLYAQKFGGCNGCGECVCDTSSGCCMKKMKNGPKNIHRITKAWSEKEVSWNKPWALPGGEYEASPLFESPNAEVNCWEEYDVTGSLMETKSADFIIQFKALGFGVRYHSSEYRKQEFRPKLHILFEGGNENETTDILASKKLQMQCNRISLSNNTIFIPVSQQAQVHITNMQGKLLSAFSTTPSISSYRIPSISDGIYIVHIKTSQFSTYKRLTLIP